MRNSLLLLLLIRLGFVSLILIIFISCDDDSTGIELPSIDLLSNDVIYRYDTLSIYGAGFNSFNGSFLVFINGEDTINYKPNELLSWEDGIIKFETDLLIGKFEIGVKYLDTISNLKPIEIISHKTLETVVIPAGTFIMGEASGMADENTIREVSITKSFLMSKYEIQQKLFRLVVKENPSELLSDYYPVSNVSWAKAIEFCNKLSLLDSLIPAYFITDSSVVVIDTADGWRLPTEAEWEYVANIDKDMDVYLGDVAWYNQNSAYKMHPSGLKNANSFGVYDIIGNLWEWCFDYYDEDYYSSGVNIDPIGPMMGEFRVLRGGAYNNGNYNIRPTYRNYLSKKKTDINTIGFRVVRNADE